MKLKSASQNQTHERVYFRPQYPQSQTLALSIEDGCGLLVQGLLSTDREACPPLSPLIASPHLYILPLRVK